MKNLVLPLLEVATAPLQAFPYPLEKPKVSLGCYLVLIVFLTKIYLTVILP